MMKYMKETRGVPKDKLKRLYYKTDKTEAAEYDIIRWAHCLSNNEPGLTADNI